MIIVKEKEIFKMIRRDIQMFEHDFFEYYDLMTGDKYPAKMARKMYAMGYDIAVMHKNTVTSEYKVIAEWRHKAGK